MIATSTKIDLKGADVSKVEDSHFKATKEPREKKGEEGFFKKETEQEEKVCIKAQFVLPRSVALQGVQGRCDIAPGACLRVCCAYLLQTLNIMPERSLTFSILWITAISYLLRWRMSVARTAV